MLIDSAAENRPYLRYEAPVLIGRSLQDLRSHAAMLLRMQILIKHSENYCFHVIIDSISEFNRATPFVPYEVHMTSGETYRSTAPGFHLHLSQGLVRDHN